MFLRLLTFLSLLFLIQQAALAQQSGAKLPYHVPDTCPVTRPSTHPFVPPPPYSAETSHDVFWYGTDELWTSLPATGTWKGLAKYTPTDPSFRQKLFWWRQGYNAHAEPRPKIKVTGKRLDSPAPPLSVDRATNAFMQHGAAMLVGINFPTLGCWEITGRYEDDELTFVVWVAK